MTLIYENIITKEMVICRNPRDVRFIDGKQFLFVENKQGRKFLVNKESLKRYQKAE